jgi:hypothetical protein
VSFLSLTWEEGVFALRLDFSLFRRKPRASPPRTSSKSKKRIGAKPLPPPFPLPPLKGDNLFDAPALAAPEPEARTAPLPLASHPPGPTPSVIVDASLTFSPDATLLMDDDDMTAVSPLESKKTDLVEQRREVRKALRGTAR